MLAWWDATDNEFAVLVATCSVLAGGIVTFLAVVAAARLAQNRQLREREHEAAMQVASELLELKRALEDRSVVQHGREPEPVSKVADLLDSLRVQRPLIPASLRRPLDELVGRVHRLVLAAQPAGDGWNPFYRNPDLSHAAYTCAVRAGALGGTIDTWVEQDTRLRAASLEIGPWKENPADELADAEDA